MGAPWVLLGGIRAGEQDQQAGHDPAVIDARLQARGGHNRFERAENNSTMETDLYVHAVVALHQRGWPVATLDATTDPPDTIAAAIVSRIQHVLTEKSAACL